IDRILREADVAKASLYSLFGSKDALVIAYVETLDEQYREAWAERTAEVADPQGKILALFDMAIDEEPGKDFRGSHFLNAAGEYPRPDTVAERGIGDACLEHRRWMHTTMTRLLNEINGYPSESQADQLLILHDHGLSSARFIRSIKPLHTAR